MNQPVLSIVTPVLNGEKYLRGFIRAVLGQRCPVIEHIFVDGASKDGSAEIIREFAAQYPHIRLISEKDTGSSDAVNKGIAMAKGDFLALLCLNDFYEPGTLNEVAGLLPTLSQPVFLVGNCNMLNEKDELLYVNKPEGLTPLGILKNKPFPYNPSAYFFHKDVYKKAGPFRECDSFDLDFLLRAFEAVKPLYMDKCWGNFRMLPDSITVKAMKAGTLDKEKEEIFKKHLKTYPFLRRFFVKIVLGVNRWPRIMYYLERIVHYCADPKDIIRLLKKIFK